MTTPSTTEKYLPSAAFDEKVEIKVGADGTPFIMHKGVLCFYSSYFQSALTRGDWIEAQEGTVRLDTEEVDVFQKFQYWAYTRHFCEQGEVDTQTVSWRTIPALWAFGDRRGIPLLQNEAVNLLNKKVVALWDGHVRGELTYAYEHTASGAPLRAYLIAIVAKTFRGHAKALQEQLRTCDREIVFDLLQMTWNAENPHWDKKAVAALNMCQYHVHEEGVLCSEGGK